jgi:predicted ATP-dependent endonuclease of OLD family
MKIKKIHLDNHPFFGTFDIDFTGPDGITPLNTIVIGGINWSGKTTLLKTIALMLAEVTDQELQDWIQGWIDIDITGPSQYPVESFRCVSPPGLSQSLKQVIAAKFKVKNIPQIVYMPTEINFDKIKIETTPYAFKPQFINTVDEDFLKDVPTFFATFIDKYVYSQNKLPDESIQMACDEINSIFKEIELESWIIGLKKDGSRMPIFQNKAGKTFDILGLSSGECQLFFRIISLKMMDTHDSIILVDEPEISLHPSWQQKIIKIYESTGRNNQVIAATHSPHILSSVPKECVRLLVPSPEIQVLF